MSEKSKGGRPKKKTAIRTSRLSGYVTEDDAFQIAKTAEAIGFKSTSELVTAIFERLCIGGFSGMAFIKLGFQFSGALSASNGSQRGLYFGVRPFPPLIGDEPDPEPENLVPFIKEMAKENKEKTA
jgi:hypothetical protein